MLQELSMRAQRWCLRRVDWLGERTGRLRGRPEHLLVGERGEREALFHLRSQGYTIVGRRWRTGRLRGDVDLIAWQGDTLCFIEVKSRALRNLLDPAEAAVDADKRRMLRKMAAAYVRSFPEEHRRSIVLRFDVISVYLSGHTAREAWSPAFDLFRGAFGERE